MSFTTVTTYARKTAKTALVSAVMLATLAPLAANAVPRVNSGAMSCSALKGYVASRGVAIVRWPSRTPGVAFSERFVANRGFCFSNERIRYRAVTTRDTNRCSLQICGEHERRWKRR